MINLQRFLDDLRSALGWPYKSPGSTDKDCSQSGIDCSGMAVRAYKLQGDKSLYHGCNTMWRDNTFEAKGRISSTADLQPGYAVLINRPWRESDSSNKWFNDQYGNFTHIGYVLSVNPLEIIDASASAGEVRITNSLKKVGWTHWGRFARVDYEGAEKPQEVQTMQYMVKSSNGLGANVRKRMSTTSELLGKVPDGDMVDAVKDIGNGWMQIVYDGSTGYCLAKLLTEAANSMTLEQTVAKLVAEAKAHGWKI